MRYRVYTEPGLESLLAEELRQVGERPEAVATPMCGWVDLRDGVMERLNRSRVASQILRFCAAGELSTLRETIAEIEIPELRRAKSFRVSVKLRNSDQERNRLAGAAGAALLERHEVAVDLTQFELELCLMVDGERWMLGVATERRLRSKRLLRPRPLRSALKPNVAAALIQLAGADRGSGRLVDPLCGAATISIEAQRANRSLEIDSFDWDEATVDVARETIAANGAELRVEALDARELGARHPQRYDYIISDPPYGVRQAKRVGTRRLYGELLSSFAAAIKPSGAAALIVVKRNALAQAAEASGWRIEREVEVELGDLVASLVRLSRPVDC